VSAVETNFTSAGFDRAKLRKADLKRAVFADAGGTDVSFAEAKLHEVDLRTAKFEKALRRRHDQGHPAARESRRTARRRDSWPTRTSPRSRRRANSRAPTFAANLRLANLKRADLGLQGVDADPSGLLLISANFGRDPPGGRLRFAPPSEPTGADLSGADSPTRTSPRRS
jgi:uncharacterized protein YjbI with pentapeptide repeats